MEQPVAIFVQDQETAEAIKQAGQSESVQVTSRRALDGAIAEWAVIGTAGSAVIRALLYSALRYVELRRISRVRVGDLEVEGATAEEIQTLLRSLPED